MGSISVDFFLSIVDDYSMRVWVYILKNKSDTFQRFKGWNVASEVKMGTKLKHIRTENGLEFVSEQFNEFYKKTCVTRHKSVVKTPQQNGVAERINKTLLERVRCMLVNGALPKSF